MDVVITEVTKTDVLRLSRASLGLPAVAGEPIDDSLIAALLRRAAGICCPCAPSTLASAVIPGLHGLAVDNDALARRVADITETLLVYGDLLELSRVTIDDENVKGSWIFAAPPSFVEGPAGSVFVLGMAKDEITPLPESLLSRVEHHEALRAMYPQPSEDLPAVLHGLGLLRLSQSSWLKTPKAEPPAEFRQNMLKRLASQLPSGSIADLSILDPELPATYYTGRWTTPKHRTGEFVARRPQAYGAPLWGFASLSDGEVTRFLDFPLKNVPWRGCDTAWHLQMAIDHCRGAAQRFRLRNTADGTSLDFFSPLPIWAQRRLTVMGRRIAPEKCLLSFLIANADLSKEIAFLKDYLWLASDDSFPTS
jgi:hypothetical protein